MGFGTIVASVMMFLGVIILSTSSIVTFKQISEDSANALRIQGKSTTNFIKSDLSIQAAVYDNETQETTVSVLNTGSTTLDPAKIDIFIDNLYVPRNTSNRTIQVQPSSEITNSGYLDPSEVLEIVVFKLLDNTTTHTASVTTPYGNKDIVQITYP